MTFTCLDRGCKTRNVKPSFGHTSRSSGGWWISLGLRDVCPEHSTLSAQVLLCWRMVRAKKRTRLSGDYSHNLNESYKSPLDMAKKHQTVTYHLFKVYYRKSPWIRFACLMFDVWGKKFQTCSPKWWWMMVRNPMVQGKNITLRQIKVI